MKALSKYFASAAAAAALTVGAAAPAQAQSWDRRDRGGIDAGDIITGVAVVGGIAAILSALGRDRNRGGYGTYGYETGYGNDYRNDYRNAVNACAYQAQRYGQGQVSVTDVDRRSRNSYRVSGVIQADYNRGYDRYGRYDRYDRNDRYGYARRARFECTVRADGRVTDFDMDRI